MLRVELYDISWVLIHMTLPPGIRVAPSISSLIALPAGNMRVPCLFYDQPLHHHPVLCQHFPSKSVPSCAV